VLTLRLTSFSRKFTSSLPQTHLVLQEWVELAEHRPAAGVGRAVAETALHFHATIARFGSHHVTQNGRLVSMIKFKVRLSRASP